MTTTETVYSTAERAAAHRGAAFLNEHWTDWRDHVDLRTLHMADQDWCVLGQLGRSLDEDSHFMLCAMIELGLEDGEVEHYGFDVSGDMSYRELNAAWKDILRA